MVEVGAAAVLGAARGDKFAMTASRAIAALNGTAIAVAAAVLAFAPAEASQPRKRNLAPVSLNSSNLGAFTPAVVDARMAAAFARSGLGSGDFHFTPATTPGRGRAVTVAVRARATTKAEAERAAMVAAPAIAPTAYNLGVAVGWKRFAISGDVARIDPGVLPGGREGVDFGLSFLGRQWSTKLQVAADRSLGDQPHLLGNDQAYSVDLGGS